ncbi:MAG: 4-hydroxy-3-methylbut-2-enyl diphosphate reductase [Spirochaetia bacterium]
MQIKIPKLSVDQVPPGSSLAIRTHGINKQEESALEKNYNLIDLTCVNVKRVQLSILDYAARGFFTVIIGKKNHPEIKGLVSYAENYVVIETPEELEDFALRYHGLLQQQKGNRVFIVSQTTGRKDIFEMAVEKIKQTCSPRTEIVTYNSICPITDRKEKEALRMQAEVDITFVVGDRLSSNANKLYTILAEKSTEVYFIADLAELISLNLPLKIHSCALLVSSASTPLFVENEIRAYLEDI